MEARGVVQAADALAAVGPAHARGQRRVHVPVALAPHTDAVRVVVALVTLVAVEASVALLALVTPRLGLARLYVAGASGCHGGARALLAAVGGMGARVETLLAELTVLPLSVLLAVQAGACGAVAALGVVVALAGLTRAFVEPVVAVTAAVTLQACDTNFALALPRVVTLVTGGSSRAAGTGLAVLAVLLGEEAVGTALAVRPRVPGQAEALPRAAVAFGAAHRAAVAQVSCKGKRNRS